MIEPKIGYASIDLAATASERLSSPGLRPFLARQESLSAAAPWFVWNASGNALIGLYGVGRASALRVADLVIVKPPEPIAQFLAAGGYLPIGAPLLKYIAALSGQEVCRIGFTITIDGTVIGDARERDNRGRPLPVWNGCHLMADGEVFLLNPLSQDSLDGRVCTQLSVQRRLFIVGHMVGR